jgi:hypothetical protein
MWLSHSSSALTTAHGTRYSIVPQGTSNYTSNCTAAGVDVNALTGAITVTSSLDPLLVGGFCELAVEAANQVAVVPPAPPSVAMVTVRFVANASTISITVNAHVRDFDRGLPNETCLEELGQMIDVDVVVVDTLPSIVAPDTRTEVLWHALNRTTGVPVPTQTVVAGLLLRAVEIGMLSCSGWDENPSADDAHTVGVTFYQVGWFS